MRLSIIASAYRTGLWPLFFNSLKGNITPFEIIFVGPNDPIGDVPSNFKFIKSPVKPCQCYEIARRAATGELIHWTADDAEYTPGWVDQAVSFWDANCDRKTVLSMQTRENGWVNSCDGHTFWGGINRGPLMAPLGILNREYVDELGGFDKRFLYGQYENDVVMRVYQDGGKLIKYEGGPLISLDHMKKHEGNGRLDDVHKADRTTLESLWVKEGKLSQTRLSELEKFEDKDLLTVSQGNKGMW